MVWFPVQLFKSSSVCKGRHTPHLRQSDSLSTITDTVPDVMYGDLKSECNKGIFGPGNFQSIRK